MFWSGVQMLSGLMPPIVGALVWFLLSGLLLCARVAGY
ncbi:hypothetical protein THIOSC13_540010 [uncultured Thiomicrorhabdus sp.]